MKHWILLTFIILLLNGFVNIVFAAGQEFEIVNYSDSDLYDLAIHPSDNDNWGPNVLPPGRPLKAGQRIVVVFSNYDSAIEQWDILSHNCCQEELVWHKLQLSTFHTITLYEGDKVELK